MNNQRKRIEIFFQLTAALIVFGLLVWHILTFHSTGVYQEMLDWTRTGKGYLTTLYDLGITVVLGLVLGFFSERIDELSRLKNTDKKNKVED